MIEGVFNQTNYLLAKQMLDVSAVRHSALASNLANVETKGYKRVDVSADFAAQLKTAVARGDKSRITQLKPMVELDPTSTQVRPDGNNVQLDTELMEINRNALEYEFLTQYLTGTFTSMKAAINGKAD